MGCHHVCRRLHLPGKRHCRSSPCRRANAMAVGDRAVRFPCQPCLSGLCRRPAFVTNEQQRIAIDKEMMCRQVQGQLTTAAYLFIPVNGAALCQYTRQTGVGRPPALIHGVLEASSNSLDSLARSAWPALSQPKRTCRGRLCKRLLSKVVEWPGAAAGKPQTDDITPVVVDIC
jgi:hypothetical protein